MAKLIDKISPEHALLDSWHPHIKNAMEYLHKKFKSDTKFILTESDLKCWLFYYLQDEKPYIPFVVHTEVTHYAKQKVVDGVKDKEYKFRDLTLLNPNNLKDAEKIWEENQDGIVNTKGYKHHGPAIHFELKMIRQSQIRNHVSGLNADIDKLKAYEPKKQNHIRDFVIVCGSRSEGTTVKDFKTAVEEKLKDFPKNSVKERLRFYLFDCKEMVCLNGNGEIIREK